MKGWLIVNSFLHNYKFSDLYNFFQNSAKKMNISLEIKTSDALVCSTNDDFMQFDLPDFIIFWDKDYYLAKRLEKLNIPLFNSSDAINLCDNKILTTLALCNKVAIPKTIIAPKTFEGIGYTKFDFLKKAIDILSLPIVIKEAYGSFGAQVYLANSFEEAKAIFDKIKYKDCLLQEFIKESYGKDIRINVIGGKVVASMMRYNASDFRSNITNGGKMMIFEPTAKQKEIAIQACKALGLDFAGVDVLFGKDDTAYICEVNSNPHFRTTFDCTGVDLSEKILNYIVGKIKE